MKLTRLVSVASALTLTVALFFEHVTGRCGWFNSPREGPRTRRRGRP